MKTTQNLTALIGSEPNYQAPVKQEIPPEVARFVDRLFIRLKAIFPAWRTAFSTDADYNEAKKIWVQALFNNGIRTADQFRTGLIQAEKSDNPFFPSVGQFIEWCKQGNTQGLPTPELLIQRYRAFRASCQEPCEFSWHSTAEYHLVMQLKQAIYQHNLSAEKTLPKAKNLIREMEKYLSAGGTLAKPTAKRLSARVKEASVEKRLANVNLLKQAIGVAV